MGFRLRPTVITFTSGVAPQALDLDVGISFNAGTDYWRIKWKGRLHETRTGTYGLFGNKAVSNGSATGFSMYFSGTGSGNIQLSRGGSQLFLTPAIILKDSSTDYVYEIEHLSDGTLIYRRDDVEVATRGAYTASSAFTTTTQVLNSLYRRSVGPTAGVPDLELEYFEAQFGAGPTRRWSGKDIVSPDNRLVREGGDGSDDFIQTSTWPTGNEEWIFYDTGTGTPVKSGTFSASAVAGASVSGSKIALATCAASAVINAALGGYKIAAASFTVSANALASVAGSKIGRSGFQAAANVYFGLGTTLKIAKGSFAAPVIASANVFGSNNVTVGGTFSASAVAGVSMSGRKVGFSGFAASAVANSNVSGSKRAAGTFHAPARATGIGNGFKVAYGSFAAVGQAQANIFGYNASIQVPVAEWVIFTASQPAVAVLTNTEPSATLFTLSQQEYSIHTNS